MAKGRKTGGRTKGALNKVTRDIREIAMDMTPDATARLWSLLKSDNEQVALGAVREVYDRAYGKASQVMALPQGSGRIMIAWQTDQTATIEGS